MEGDGEKEKNLNKKWSEKRKEYEYFFFCSIPFHLYAPHITSLCVGAMDGDKVLFGEQTER